MNIDVLLVNPRTDDRQKPPLGLAYISAILKKEGISTRIYDPLPEDKMKERLIELIDLLSPKIIGITATTIQMPIAFELAKAAKEKDRGIVTVIGGAHVSAVPEEVAGNEYVDFASIGESEYTARELFKKILANEDTSGVQGIAYKKNNEVIFTEKRQLIQNLDEIPYPARELLDEKWYFKRGSLIRGLWLKTAIMITSRGCPGMCIYCASNNTFGRKIRRRSVENVIGEIKELIKKYKIDSVYFCDDTMTTDKDWMAEFCSGLMKLDKKLIWACNSRVNTLNEKMLSEMKKAGCVQIEFGCESGSQKVLNALKKGITIKEMRDAFALTKKFGIRTMANFMIGCPEETEEDLNMTLTLAKELNADYTDFWITTPYPGSELYRIAKEKGWLKQGGTWEHGHRLSKPIMEINFTAEELVNHRDNLYRQTFNPILKNIVLTPSFVYDVSKFIVTHPGTTINGAKAGVKNKSLMKFGLYIEEQMRGIKKDIIL